MDHPSQTLPGAGTLISDTWKLFTSTWNTSVKTSILFLYVGLLYFAGALLVKFNEAYQPIDLLLRLAAGVLTVWITIRVFLTMLRLEENKQPLAAREESTLAWSLWLSLIWVGLLTGLAVFGGMLLLILPGIYLSVVLAYSQILMIDQGIKGTQALAGSRALVKGRFWPTLWRMLAGNVVFGLLIGALMLLGIFIVVQIVGTAAIAEKQDVLAAGALQLIWMVIYAAFAPLLLGYQVKLYRTLKNSK